MKVIYCAYGKANYATQLAQSLRSLHQYHPDARVEVYTTADYALALKHLPVKIVVLDGEAAASDWHDPFMKLRAVDHAAQQAEPFLYLDNDTYIAGSLAGAWALLERVDCMGVLSPLHDQRGALGLGAAVGVLRPDPLVVPEWNGGVLFFSGRPAAAGVARRWLEVQQMRIPGGGDQWPLSIALWDSGARLHVLPPNFNCRLPACPTVYGPVHILHADHPNLAGVAGLINADDGLRRIIPKGDGYATEAVPVAGRLPF